MSLLSILNPNWDGKLIFAFRRIRSVALIELRRGSLNSIPDLSALFYIQRMESSILQNHIDLNLFESIQEEAKKYVIYEIFFSTQDEKAIQKELGNQFDYYLVSYSDNLVNDYHQVKRDFELKCNSGNFCLITDLSQLLFIHKKHLKIFESGKLAA